MCLREGGIPKFPGTGALDRALLASTGAQIAGESHRNNARAPG